MDYHKIKRIILFIFEAWFRQVLKNPTPLGCVTHFRIFDYGAIQVFTCWKRGISSKWTVMAYDSLVKLTSPPKLKRTVLNGVKKTAMFHTVWIILDYLKARTWFGKWAVLILKSGRSKSRKLDCLLRIKLTALKVKPR